MAHANKSKTQSASQNPKSGNEMKLIILNLGPKPEMETNHEGKAWYIRRGTELNEYFAQFMHVVIDWVQVAVIKNQVNLAYELGIEVHRGHVSYSQAVTWHTLATDV